MVRGSGQVWARRTVGAVLVVTVSAGCAVIDDFRTSEFAQQDAETIARASWADMGEVTSMRVNGSLRFGADRYILDLQLSDDQCTGNFRQNRGELEIRETRRGNWYRGDKALIDDVLRRSPEPRRAKVSPGKWFRDDEGHPWCDLDYWVKAFKVRKDGTDADGRTMRVGDETDLDGTRVVEVITEVTAATQEPVAYVAVDEPHRVLKIESEEAKEGFNLAFSRYDEEFEVTPPNT